MDLYSKYHEITMDGAEKIGIIRITRDANITFDYQRFDIILDGKKVGFVRCGRSKMIPVDSGHHRIHIEFFYFLEYFRYSSHEIEFSIEEGELVEFKTGFHNINYYFGFLYEGSISLYRVKTAC